MNKSLEKFLKDEGYKYLKEISGKVCGLYPFIYTWGLVVGLDEDGYEYRYCYPSLLDAKKALEEYTDLDTHPTGPWIKRKGDGGDIPNPEAQTHLDVNF